MLLLRLPPLQFAWGGWSYIMVWSLIIIISWNDHHRVLIWWSSHDNVTINSPFLLIRKLLTSIRTVTRRGWNVDEKHIVSRFLCNFLKKMHYTMVNKYNINHWDKSKTVEQQIRGDFTISRCLWSWRRESLQALSLPSPCSPTLQSLSSLAWWRHSNHQHVLWAKHKVKTQVAPSSSASPLLPGLIYATYITLFLSRCHQHHFYHHHHHVCNSHFSSVLFLWRPSTWRVGWPPTASRSGGHISISKSSL